jgi:hypothetical protein
MIESQKHVDAGEHTVRWEVPRTEAQHAPKGIARHGEIAEVLVVCEDEPLLRQRQRQDIPIGKMEETALGDRGDVDAYSEKVVHHGRRDVRVSEKAWKHESGPAANQRLVREALGPCERSAYIVQRQVRMLGHDIAGRQTVLQKTENLLDTHSRPLDDGLAV